MAQQNNASDPRTGLLQQLRQTPAGKERLTVLLELATFYKSRNLQDSGILFANNARHLSQELKWDSGYYEASNLLCKIYVFNRRFKDALALLPQVPQEQQARLRIVIGENYLFRPALHKQDLDTAFSYFSQALQDANAARSRRWKHESLIALGKYYFAANEFSKGKASFMEIIADHQASRDSSAEAHIWSELGKYMPDSDSTFKDEMYAHEMARKLYHALKDTNNERSTLEDIGAVNHLHANFALAKQQFLEAVRLRELVGNKKTYVDYRMLAFIAHASGDLDEALQYALKSASLDKAAIEARLISILLGEIYSDDQQHGKSLEHFLSVKQIGKEWRYFVCRRVVEQYIALGQPAKALAHIRDFEKEGVAETPPDKESMAAAKGDCYAALNNNVLAEKYYREMITLDELAQQRRKREVIPLPFTVTGAEAYYKIADFYAKQNNPVAAGTYVARALHTGSFSGNQFYTSNLMRKIWWLKFKVDSTTGNHLSAIQSYERYTALNDSIFTAAKSRQLQQLQVKYETGQKEQAILARDLRITTLTQNDLLRQANLKQVRLTRNITMGAVVVLLVFGGLLYRQYSQKRKANQLITTQNEQLQHLVTEKEWLLKEVHHRVKNNLHTIICLLESQAVFLENDALKAIENSQHRVYAMSLIHQKLYQTENVKTIEMGEYLPEFISYLRDSYDLSQNIIFDLDIHSLQLDVAQAIPVALILNEAVTNAIKYAFPGNRKGIIRVCMHRSGEDVSLVIADNGIGIQENIKEANLNSLGMELMKGLSEDINGCIQFENDHGTRITVSFKMDPVTKPKYVIKQPGDTSVAV